MNLVFKKCQNSKLVYYFKNIARQFLPASYYQKKRRSLLARVDRNDRSAIERRVNYYLKHNKPFSLSEKATAIKDIKLREHGSFHYYDLKEYLNYFNRNLKVGFISGDVVRVEPHATLVKSRPIFGGNSNSVLFKLGKLRHFSFVNDPMEFSEKEDRIVWRGNARRPNRKELVRRFWDHSLCDVGQTNKRKENVPWQKRYMSVAKQLQYKFVLCIEGNDVATNLKWTMSSNSLCMMTKPKCETWFMEGVLKAGKHYVELKDDYSDLEEKILYYTERIDEAKAIIANAHDHVAQFLDQDKEDLIALSVLEKYFKLSGQCE
jgi:hypothetical protein